MGIIIKSERKMTTTRMLVVAFYLLLLIGGITMIVPFLLMVSGSVKGKVDAYDFDLLPKFLYDKTLLYKKYTEEKYNERVQDYQVATHDYISNFKALVPPTLPSEKLILDWGEFCRKEDNPVNYSIGALTATIAARQMVVPKNLRNFRSYIRDLCQGDIEVFQNKYSTKLKDWYYISIQVERLMDRNYTLPAGNNLFKALMDFKKSRPAPDRIYLSVDGAFIAKCKMNDTYQSDILIYNSINETNFNSFNEIVVDPRVPENSKRKCQWEQYVRKSLHPQFIYLMPEAHENYGNFLKNKYKEISNLNKMYNREYNTFRDVPFPVDKLTASPELIDYSLFLQDTLLLSSHNILLDTPELRWRQFLKSRYPNIAGLNTAHQRLYPNFDQIPMPQKEMDYYYCSNNSLSLRWHYITRNYKMVLEYVTIYGQGILNTLIYCFLAILVALTINPLAAYALSRYRLPSQYKILLFFITTVAFPAMVTMIPNYLLLKDLGLLNTFAALILPGMANGYSIFLLKGFFDTLPRELFEAAELDGASEWYKFWGISLKLSTPILAVIALGAFTAAYGNFMFAFVLCQDSAMWTLMVWLYQLQYYTAPGVQFASLLIAAIPTLVVFIMAQRIIIRGIVVPQEK